MTVINTNTTAIYALDNFKVQSTACDEIYSITLASQ
jgi:hypothetical protein